MDNKAILSSKEQFGSGHGFYRLDAKVVRKEPAVIIVTTSSDFSLNLAWITPWYSSKDVARNFGNSHVVNPVFGWVHSQNVWCLIKNRPHQETKKAKAALTDVKDGLSKHVRSLPVQMLVSSFYISRISTNKPDIAYVWILHPGSQQSPNPRGQY